jgi:protoporphyrinogen oxidase
MKVVILGAGIAGLVAAYTLAKTGKVQVTLVEQAERAGGLAASFPLADGQEVENYYHFICKPDATYRRLLHELGIAQHLHWKTTRMGLFYHGAMHTLSDPLSLLRFPHLSWWDKWRFAWATMRAKMTPHDTWQRIEHMRAQEWLIRNYGKRTYAMLYAPLMHMKFRAYAADISAAWMWARFHRLGRSRTLTQQERIGYLAGGSQTYVNALVQAAQQQGVVFAFGNRAEALLMEQGHVTGVRTSQHVFPCDVVLSTIPLPALLPLVQSLHGAYWDNLRSLRSLGVVVLLLRLKQSLSKYFWLNVNDPRIDLAGIIEYTNLNPCPQLGGDTLLYLPHYLPASHPLFRTSDDVLLHLSCRSLKLIQPAFDTSWVREYHVHRDRFSQPICERGFSHRHPAMQTPISNFYLTDSHQLHPHDRSISDSSDLGEQVARLIMGR